MPSRQNEEHDHFQSTVVYRDDFQDLSNGHVKENEGTNADVWQE